MPNITESLVKLIHLSLNGTNEEDNHSSYILNLWFNNESGRVQVGIIPWNREENFAEQKATTKEFVVLEARTKKLKEFFKPYEFGDGFGATARYLDLKNNKRDRALPAILVRTQG